MTISAIKLLYEGIVNSGDHFANLFMQARYRTVPPMNVTIVCYKTIVQTIVCYNNVVAYAIATAYSYIWAELGLL